MKFSDWLSLQPKRLSLVAKRYNISASAVSQWKLKGVPVERMLDIVDMACGDIALEELVQEVVELRRGR